MTWIKKKSFNNQIPEFLNEEELPVFFSGAENLRERVIVHLLYDSGARLGEFREIKIKDILPDNQLKLRGKTGERIVLWRLQ
ncbi:MAG: hypothetical protein ACE5K4_10170 [Candidatus Hydrothermarchaeota archaeon]